MFKRVAVFAMALASLGAMVPVSAAAAERFHDQKTVVVVNRNDRCRVETHAHRVIIRRGDERFRAADRWTR